VSRGARAGFPPKGIALALLLAACGEPSTPVPDAGVDASISSPLATEPPEPLSLDAGAPGDGGIIGIPADSSGRLILPDGGAPPPEPFRADGPVASEAPGSKDLAGVSLDGAVRWRDVPAAPKAPEVSADGLKEALKLTALAVHVDVTESGRLRMELGSRALPLPGRTELRARSDRYGHLLLWPNATDYRVIPAGALRTLLGERRVDVMPLVAGQVRSAGEAKRLGVTVRKVDVTAPLGTLRLDLGKVTEAGEGGPLLCRTFVEMLSVDPKSPVCQPGEVPLFASFAWQEGGGIAWEATALNRRTDFSPADFVVPPAGARHAPASLPIAPGGVFLSKDEIAAFRTGPANLPGPADPAAPGEGFVAVNQTDMLLYLLLDGVPVAIVPPLADKYVIGTVRGRYVVQWRTFLGEKVFPPAQVEMPARFTIGSASAADAGAPDAGK
jgi:hypothetical protein